MALAVAGLFTSFLLPARTEIVTPRATFAAQLAAGMPTSARAAVEQGLRIWSERLASPVPIEVDVRWARLPRGVAGVSEPASYQQATPDGPFDPVALVNAVTGVDHSRGADITMTLNSAEPWYFGDGAPPPRRTDMVTFVLHEMGHGLGLIGSFQRSHDDSESLGWGLRDATGVVRPVGMDRFVADAANGRFLASTGSFANPSRELFAAATGRGVVWGGNARDSRGEPIALYAPGHFEDHSSLSHLDDDVYPRGDADALMTSLIRRGESMRRIGPAALGMLADLGWTVLPETAVAPRVEPAVSATAPAPTSPPTSPHAPQAAPRALPTSAPPPPQLAARAIPRAPASSSVAVQQAGALAPTVVIAGALLSGWALSRPRTRPRRTSVRPSAMRLRVARAIRRRR